MWMITEDGFFSAVQADDDDTLVTVRTRVRADLVFLCGYLRDKEAPHEITTRPNSDYPWRTVTTKTAWADYCADSAALIDYPNFKDRVKDATDDGPIRASVYGKVWADLYELEFTDPDRRDPADRWTNA